MRIEGEGLVAVPSRSATMRYHIRLPGPAPIAARHCAVCGTDFVPQTSQVRTCGRSCGGRARFSTDPVPAPSCSHCGGPSCGTRMCRGCRKAFGSVQARLRTIGVLGNKHIPVEYLRASETQRRALLAGLLDTDGTVTMGGSAQYTGTNQRLVSDVAELVVSLGYRCQISTKAVAGRRADSSVAYTITFATDDVVFGLHRKAMAHKQRRRSTNTARSNDPVHLSSGSGR